MKTLLVLSLLALSGCQAVPPLPGADPFVARVGAAIATIPETREPLIVDAVLPTKPEDTEPVCL